MLLFSALWACFGLHASYYLTPRWEEKTPSFITSLSGEMRSRTQVQRKSGVFNNKTKQRTKTTPKGKNKQAGRQKTGAQSNVKHSHDIRQRISTGLQTQGDYIGRQMRVTRETQLEPLKQWLSNKMGGDRQSTWEHMAPTNNKPCAQHTETSGGQPGHTSRTVTVISFFYFSLFSFRWVSFQKLHLPQSPAPTAPASNFN